MTNSATMFSRRLNFKHTEMKTFIVNSCFKNPTTVQKDQALAGKHSGGEGTLEYFGYTKYKNN